MKKTALVGAVASLCLVGSAGTAALATSHHPAAASKLKVKLSTTKPSAGQGVTATLSGAAKGVNYTCLLTTYKKGVSLSAGDADVASDVDSGKVKHGKSVCHEIFVNFVSPHGHSCPPSKADKKAGWKCGVAIADPKNHKHYAVGLFKF